MPNNIFTSSSQPLWITTTSNSSNNYTIDGYGNFIYTTPINNITFTPSYSNHGIQAGQYINNMRNNWVANTLEISCPLCKDKGKCFPPYASVCANCNNYAVVDEFHTSGVSVYTELIRISSTSVFSRTKLRKDYGDCYLFYGLENNFSLNYLTLDYWAEENALYIPLNKYPELNSTDYSQIIETMEKLLLLI